MTTDKIQFTKEKETMLMTLSGRAIQSQWENPILPDPWAEEAMRHIDYDLNKKLTGVASWSMWRDIGPTVIATRAATLDQLTTRFLADHPDAVVLQVGCGMDSRALRVNPPAGVAAGRGGVVRRGLPGCDRPAPSAVSRARSLSTG
jgi:O-methyltransferase involved in polyketide biosynthesis